MKYLTPEQVLFIHAHLVTETGGARGVRDLGMLLFSSLARGSPLVGRIYTSI